MEWLHVVSSQQCKFEVEACLLPVNKLQNQLTRVALDLNVHRRAQFTNHIKSTNNKRRNRFPKEPERGSSPRCLSLIHVRSFHYQEKWVIQGGGRRTDMETCPYMQLWKLNGCFTKNIPGFCYFGLFKVI